MSGHWGKLTLVPATPGPGDEPLASLFQQAGQRRAPSLVDARQAVGALAPKMPMWIGLRLALSMSIPLRICTYSGAEARTGRWWPRLTRR